MEEKRKKEFNELIEKYKLRKILSSCHLNFLFGAGLNGELFPQLSDFNETNKELNNYKKLSKSYNFEDELSSLKKDDRKKVLGTFIMEFNSFIKKVDLTNKSHNNIISMINEIYSLIEKTENTIESMSKVNLFTFNYDSILEDAIQNEGYFANVIKPSNLKSLRFHSVLVRNIENLRDIPSFVVSKLHGSVENGLLSKENIVLPGIEKYHSALNKDSFELLFKMKSELLKSNSVLIVIGYSWNDEHVNQILKDCIKNGLTMIWFQYNKKDKHHNDFKEKVIKIPYIDRVQDTTLSCSELFYVVQANDYR